MSWYTAAALVQLIREVNDRWSPPTWPTVSIGDGSVGDTSHAARYSSHNPLWSTNPPGCVRAVDIGIEGRNARAILNEVIGDPRVWYVIHKGVIYSRTYGWRALRYTGSNPHNHHIHVSLRESEAAYDDTRPWFGPTKPRRTRPRATTTEEFDMDEQTLRKIIREEVRAELDMIRLEDRDQPKVKRSVTGLLLETDRRVGNIERDMRGE